MEDLKSLAREDADVKAFIAKGFEETLDALYDEMPFPLVYSLICLRPTDGNDGDVLSTEVKKIIKRAKNHPLPDATPLIADAKKVAIVGSGPAGLTAAWELIMAGYSVTVFESLPEPGGMLKMGIPGYRLPKDVVDLEIDRIKALGVIIKTDTAVDADFFKTLIEGSEYQVVFVATGAFKSRKLGLEGEDLNGVLPAIEFLKEYNLSGNVNIGKRVVVIGGGNVATDAAGAALRSGAESVRLFCLEDRKAMPAHEWEIEEAAADGVEINPSWGPTAIVGNGTNVTSVRFVRCKSVFDDNGKFSPIFNKKESLDIEADTVITAIGQGPDLSFLCEGIRVERGCLQADPYTMETGMPGLFAGGDAVSGTASLIEAIADGKTAAASIIHYLEGKTGDGIRQGTVLCLTLPLE